MKVLYCGKSTGFGEWARESTLHAVNIIYDVKSHILQCSLPSDFFTNSCRDHWEFPPGREAHPRDFELTSEPASPGTLETTDRKFLSDVELYLCNFRDSSPFFAGVSCENTKLQGRCCIALMHSAQKGAHSR